MGAPDDFARVFSAFADALGEDYSGTFSRRSMPYHETAVQARERAQQFKVGQLRRKLDKGERQRREYSRSRAHDYSPLGCASEAAWWAYLATPAAQAQYANYGFEVATPEPTAERLVLERRRPVEWWSGGSQVVASVERGDD